MFSYLRVCRKRNSSSPLSIHRRAIQPKTAMPVGSSHVGHILPCTNAANERRESGVKDIGKSQRGPRKTSESTAQAGTATITSGRCRIAGMLLSCSGGATKKLRRTTFAASVRRWRLPGGTVHEQDHEDQAEAAYPETPNGPGPHMMRPKGFDERFLF
jgi:hypothetical protein